MKKKINTFKIVVTRAGRDTFWYAKNIGDEFDVVGVRKIPGDGDSNFMVRVGTDEETYMVSWKDCELLAEE